MSARQDGRFLLRGGCLERLSPMNVRMFQWFIALVGGLFTTIGVFGCSPIAADAYVLPASQIVKFMTANFSSVRSVEIVQTVLVGAAPDEEPQPVFEEKVWLKAPAYYAAERVPLQGLPMVGEREPSGEQAAVAPVPPISATRKPEELSWVFRRFLMANEDEVILQLLEELGVHTGFTGFERWDRKVAYRIGRREPGSPKLLVEKETFLPLLLQYQVFGESGPHLLAVHFGEYEKCGEASYPHEIIYAPGNGTREIYRIRQIRLNVPVRRPLLEITFHPVPSEPPVQELTGEDRPPGPPSGFVQMDPKTSNTHEAGSNLAQ